jgi:hypothetical protein
MIDDNQKMFIPPLDIFSLRLCKSLYDVKPKVQSVRDGALELKGSHSMGDGRIFLKSRRDVSFKKGLSNEPTFGLIHLAGQYLNIFF